MKPAPKRIQHLLAHGDDRPAYMVLRHAGIEPRGAIHALCAAGLRPAQHGILCRELTPEQRDTIADNA